MDTRIPKFVSKAVNARLVSGFSLSKAIECGRSQKWLTEAFGLHTDSPVFHVNGTGVFFNWKNEQWSVVPA
jgi:hypothetical protein